MNPSIHPDFVEFESIIGYRFKSHALLRQALTHRSFMNEYKGNDRHDNERMEFLGDSVVDFVAADILYALFPQMPEGELTRLRAAIVRTEALAMLGEDCQIGQFLQMGKGEERSGGRKRINNLCRAFEALIGAIYLDRGMDSVRDFLAPRLEQLLQQVLELNLHHDARSELQERSQSELSITPRYRTVNTVGPDHRKEFQVEVTLDGIVIGRGTGNSKRLAAQAAARVALKQVEGFGWPASIIEDER